VLDPPFQNFLDPPMQYAVHILQIKLWYIMNNSKMYVDRNVPWFCLFKYHLKDFFGVYSMSICSHWLRFPNSRTLTSVNLIPNFVLAIHLLLFCTLTPYTACIYDFWPFLSLRYVYTMYKNKGLSRHMNYFRHCTAK
jgi:hypothetical protein